MGPHIGLVGSLLCRYFPPKRYLVVRVGLLTLYRNHPKKWKCYEYLGAPWGTVKPPTQTITVIHPLGEYFLWNKQF